MDEFNYLQKENGNTIVGLRSLGLVLVLVLRITKQDDINQFNSQTLQQSPSQTPESQLIL